MEPILNRKMSVIVKIVNIVNKKSNCNIILLKNIKLIGNKMLISFIYDSKKSSKIVFGNSKKQKIIP